MGGKGYGDGSASAAWTRGWRGRPCEGTAEPYEQVLNETGPEQHRQTALRIGGLALAPAAVTRLGALAIAVLGQQRWRLRHALSMRHGS